MLHLLSFTHTVHMTIAFSLSSNVLYSLGNKIVTQCATFQMVFARLITTPFHMLESFLLPSLISRNPISYRVNWPLQYLGDPTQERLKVWDSLLRATNELTTFRI